MRVSIVGFGYVGTTLGAMLAKRGCRVSGIDINPNVVDTINHGQCLFHEPALNALVHEQHQAGRLRAFSDFSPIKASEIIIVTVDTPLSPNGHINLGNLTGAVKNIAPYLQKNQLVIFKSTVPPGTTAALMQDILQQQPRIKVAYCPERLAEGEALNDLKKIPVVVGGINKESLEAACDFWQDVLGVKTVKVKNLETAELVKLADNVWIDLNIALANELAQLCNQYGNIDALELIAAANTLPKLGGFVNILRPSLGVGGSCLTKDPWFLHQLAQSFGLNLQLPQTARRINDQMPHFSFSLVMSALLANGKQPTHCHVAILGITFKSNTSDCRHSPVKSFIEHLLQAGIKVTVYDPYAAEKDAMQVTQVRLSSSWESAVRGADCVAFLAGHDALRQIAFDVLATLVAKNTIIFDGRMFYTESEINRLQSFGLQYLGVGRPRELVNNVETDPSPINSTTEK